MEWALFLVPPHVEGLLYQEKEKRDKREQRDLRTGDEGVGGWRGHPPASLLLFPASLLLFHAPPRLLPKLFNDSKLPQYKETHMSKRFMRHRYERRVCGTATQDSYHTHILTHTYYRGVPATDIKELADISKRCLRHRYVGHTCQRDI